MQAESDGSGMQSRLGRRSPTTAISRGSSAIILEQAASAQAFKIEETREKVLRSLDKKKKNFNTKHAYRRMNIEGQIESIKTCKVTAAADCASPAAAV